MNKVLPILAIIIIGISLLIYNIYDPLVIDSESFRRNDSDIQYTRHARCRMSCRQISEAEVIDILTNGKINKLKSDPHDKPCPTFALEGYTKQDGQHVRIVFAQCESILRVITCIDLDREFTCNCK